MFILDAESRGRFTKSRRYADVFEAQSAVSPFTELDGLG